jgi:predicted nuclease with TOPRIM domain
MLKPVFITFVLVALASPCFAQMSAREAQEKLADKQANEAIAATQPSGFTNAQVDQLEETIRELRAQNAKLSDTLAKLQQQLQTLQQAGQNFWGETEARVGMTMDDLKRLPDVDIELTSEDTSGSVYKVSTGKVNDYATRSVDDLPSVAVGQQSRTESVIVGSHPAEIQRVVVDAASGKVVEVRVYSEQ